MVVLAVCSGLVGALLGLRFRVIVLFPFIFIGSAILIAIMPDATWPRTILAIAVFASALQLGYVCALLLRPAFSALGSHVRLPFLGSPKLR
ncbi:hypothetical protein [Bradyrhizobium prioriisuperbiae]|uniref:hypothetical protein n=1 Tax=Bradyrhizobium prioriisuperbiae TaxID=2854389 RepID=UPI0028EE36A4|nr:hypothetical protein [Bradyrhizobium prioritasuperba]